MAINEQIIKITPYKGLYFLDSKKLFEGKKEITAPELQRRVKAPYTIVLKYYVEKGKIKVEQKHIANDNHTIKRICDELMVDRGKIQLNKNFTEEVVKTIPTLDDFFKKYQVKKETTQAIKTFTSNQYFYNKWISPAIGKKLVDDITTEDLQEIAKAILKDGRSPRTTDTLKDLLRPVFKLAIKQKLCTDNPALDIEIPTYDNQVYFLLSDIPPHFVKTTFSNILFL